ncbi:MAG: ribonuclease III [Candidatus Cloacimonetes bacterium]|nr:ribonuclease III [Candidatus Cloacimonadota bacterium]
MFFQASPEWLEKIVEFQKEIKYTFNDITLLHAAFMHLSYFHKLEEYSGTPSPSERMEFLGDSILGLVVAEELFKLFPESSEGPMSMMKSKIVSETYLSMVAQQIKLGKYLLLSPEESRSGGRHRKSILSDSMEALICAIYLDSNLTKARSFIKRLIMKEFDTRITHDDLRNYKSILQEYAQSLYQEPPEYRLLEEKGPDHNKTFSYGVFIQEQQVGKGVGASKKLAHQDAAKAACKKLKLL